MPATEDTAGLIATAVAHGTAYQGPETVYLALVSTTPTKTVAGTEITLGSYARYEFAQSGWTDDAAGNLENTADILYPLATANYDAPVVAVEAYTLASGGTRLWWLMLSTPLNVVAGQTPKLPAGDLKLSLV